eukprot:scpid29159/ scgid17362/ 
MDHFVVDERVVTRLCMIRRQLLASLSLDDRRKTIKLRISLRIVNNQVVCSGDDYEKMRTYLAALVCSANVAAVEELFGVLNSVGEAVSSDADRKRSGAVVVSDSYRLPSRLSELTVTQCCHDTSRNSERQKKSDKPGCTAGAGEYRECTYGRTRQAAFLVRVEAGVNTHHRSVLTPSDYLYPAAKTPMQRLVLAKAIDSQRRSTGRKARKVDTAAVSVKRLVNDRHLMIWSNPAMVHCALLVGSEEMLLCLTKWGADVTQLMNLVSELNVIRALDMLTCLSIAVQIRAPALVRALLFCGESPHRRLSVRQLKCMSQPHWFWPDNPVDIATFEALWSCPEFPPPGSLVFRSLATSPSEYGPSLLQHHRWDSDCTLVDIATTSKDYEVLEAWLDAPCYTPDEVLCKRFFCNLSLMRVCCNTTQSPRRLAAIVRLLLQQGIKPTVLLLHEAEELCKRWLLVRRREISRHNDLGECTSSVVSELKVLNRSLLVILLEYLAGFGQCVNGIPIRRHPFFDGRLFDDLDLFNRNSPPFCYWLPPALVRLKYCEQHRPGDDDVLQLLIRHGGVPGLQSVAEIPMAGGGLHNGPLCRCTGVSLTDEQRQVSGLDIIVPDQQPLRLQELCRAVIIDQCQLSHGPVAAIRKLSLPHTVRGFLLFDSKYE